MTDATNLLWEVYYWLPRVFALDLAFFAAMTFVAQRRLRRRNARRNAESLAADHGASDRLGGVPAPGRGDAPPDA